MQKKITEQNIISYINTNTKNISFIGLKKIVNQQSLINIRGTGLLLKNKKIITCAHIYDQIPENERPNLFCGIIEISSDKIDNYKIFTITFEKKNTDRDFVVFNVNNSDNKINNYGVDLSEFLDIDEIEKISKGEGLYFSGFSLANELLKMGMGITLTTDKCIVSSIKYKNLDKKIDFLLVDKQINPGGSGSPVFYKNRIIGLASGTINKTQKVSDLIIQVPVGLGIIRTSNYLLELLRS